MQKRKFARPRKKKLDQEKVQVFLKSIEFDTLEIHQEWRHLHAFGIYQDREAVFKLASTQKTGRYTQNEYNWNEAVHLTPQNTHPNFTVPKNFASGYYGKLFYFIAQRFVGEPFTQRNSPNLDKVTKKIPQITKATYELENLPIPKNCVFAKGKKKKVPKPIGHKLLASSTEWAAQVPKDLDSYITVIEKAKNNLRTSVGHGDYVIRQMYDVSGKIGIIDGENAGIRGPLYYDVAQFYIRLRNDHDAENLAREFLLEFQKLLSPTDKKTFWEELKPVLIERYIGDLWGAAKNPLKLVELEPLGKEILGDKIL